MDAIINVPEIQEVIRKSHKEFIEAYGSLVEKVVADNRLFADVISARLYRIAVCFKEERIIDEIQMLSNGPCKKMRLTKSGCDNTIYVITNGKSIMLEGIGYALSDFMSDPVIRKKRIDGVQKEDYDWTIFAKNLLDYIHEVIYERKEAAETKVEEMFENAPKNERKVRTSS